MKSFITSLLLAEAVLAFPWVLDVAGVDSSMLVERQQPGTGAGGAATCPFNANHQPAVAFNPKYPYNNAKNGSLGNQKGGFLVPAKGDYAHRYIPPTSKDIRGPCPGLNTAANHGFLARDGVTTYDELVDAQQNVYNVGYDLANLLAFLGLQADGDFVTQKLSIGCDATTRTSFNPTLTGSEPGLDGHNKFEGDSSLTRNDFFFGNNYSFNKTLFNMMTQTTGGNFDLKGLGLYRKQRYDQSRATNPNFYFGPLSLLLFGAASFLYELFPSGTRGYAPDLYTMKYFFIKEEIPPNWTNRVQPYTNMDVGQQIIEMYLEHPVEFGGNTGYGQFNSGLSFGTIQNGKLGTTSPTDTSCLLYQLATGQVPSSLNGILTPGVDAAAFLATRVSPMFANLGCPRPLT